MFSLVHFLAAGVQGLDEVTKYHSIFLDFISPRLNLKPKSEYVENTVGYLPHHTILRTGKSAHDDFRRAHDDHGMCHNHFLVMFIMAVVVISPVPSFVGNKTAAGDQSENAGE